VREDQGKRLSNLSTKKSPQRPKRAKQKREGALKMVAKTRGGDDNTEVAANKGRGEMLTGPQAIETSTQEKELVRRCTGAWAGGKRDVGKRQGRQKPVGT